MEISHVYSKKVVNGDLESLNDKQCVLMLFVWMQKQCWANKTKNFLFVRFDLKKCISKMTDILEVYCKDFKIAFNTYKLRLQSFPNILNIREVHQYELVYLCVCLSNTCEKNAKFCTTSTNIKCLNNCVRLTSKISL